MIDSEENRNQTDEPTSAMQTVRELLDRKLVVLIVLFGITAVMGLPLLWMSRGFNWWQKVFWSLLVVIYTIGLLAVTWRICQWAWESVQTSLG